MALVWNLNRSKIEITAENELMDDSKSIFDATGFGNGIELGMNLGLY